MALRTRSFWLAIACVLLGAWLPLGACSTAADEGMSSASAVADVRSAAGQSLAISWRVFDALLTAVDALQKGGVVKSGSPGAARLAAVIERTRTALDAATEALRRGDRSGFTDSLTVAQARLAETKAAIGDGA